MDDMGQKADEYAHMWKKQFEEQERKIAEIRRIKHDMQAHFLVLQYYLDGGMYDEASTYLALMRNQEYTKQTEDDIEVGNPLVNAILKEYLRKGQTKVSLSVKGQLPKHTNVSDYDWCVLFSNMMSNAMEACQKLKNTHKEIHLTITTEENKIGITMKNPLEWEIDTAILGKTTTKEEKELHGFGLKNMNSVVEKYDGSVEYRVESNAFEIKIWLKQDETE